jgi:MEMO1 family protein
MKVTFALFIITAITISGLFYLNRHSEGEVAGTSEAATRIHGLILPHHDKAGSLIDSAASRVSQSGDYSTLVILAPNHFQPDSQLITTADTLANFPISQAIVSKLAATSDYVVLDNTAISKEHGLLVPLEYLSAKFGNTDIIPLMVSPNYTDDSLSQVAAMLHQHTPEDTLFVVSVDFSHNLLFEPAMENTKYTSQIISAFDQDKLLTFDDHYLDAPVAVVLMLEIMKLRQATLFETWEISHGAILLDNPLLQGTSYLTGVFRE